MREFQVFTLNLVEQKLEPGSPTLLCLPEFCYSVISFCFLSLIFLGKSLSCLNFMENCDKVSCVQPFVSYVRI